MDPFLSMCQDVIVPVDEIIVPPSWYHWQADVLRDDYANMVLWKSLWQYVSFNCFAVGCCQLVLALVYNVISTPMSFWCWYIVIRLLVNENFLMLLVFL
jgi:hypothetical protein